MGVNMFDGCVLLGKKRGKCVTNDFIVIFLDIFGQTEQEIKK